MSDLQKKINEVQKAIDFLHLKLDQAKNNPELSSDQAYITQIKDAIREQMELLRKYRYVKTQASWKPFPYKKSKK